MTKDKDMTVGNPFSLIGMFAISLIIGNLFQQLYTFVDTIIIGKKIGALGVAAIGGTEWLIFLVNGLVIGLVQGFLVLLGNSFGEKKEEEYEMYYEVSKKICVVLAVILTILLTGTSGIILKLLGTKEEIYFYAKDYVTIIFMGIPFLVFGQLFSAALRSRGNSKVPMAAMTISSFCNIFFDILFVNILEIGITGAALGTLLSECVVMIICGCYFYGEKKRIGRLKKSYSNSLIAIKLLKMGIPMALQSVITSIGGLIVVNRINQYDITFLTGYTAAGKLYALLEIPASSYGLAVTSYVSQNYGANKFDRINKGVIASLKMGVVTALICSSVMVFGGRKIMNLFIDSPEMTVDIITYGYRFLCILAIFFPLLYILYIMRASLQGMNCSIIPMISSFGQLVMRLLCAILLTMFIGSDGIFWGEISAWLLADVILLIGYFYYVNKI